MMSSTSTDAKKRCEKCLQYVKIYITCFKCDAAYHIYCWKKVPGAYVNPSGQLFCCCGLTPNCPSVETKLGTQYNPPERVIKKKNIYGCSEDLKNYPVKVEGSELNEFKCNVCLLEFPDKEHLKNHYSECFNKKEGFIQELKEDKDWENCLHKEENLEWSEFRCCACHLEFTNKEHFENHYNACSNKEERFILDLKKDTDVDSHLPKEENSQSNQEHLENHYSESPNKQGRSVAGLYKNKAGLFCSFCNEENFQKKSHEQHIKRCHVATNYSRLNEDNSICITNTKSNLPHVDDKEKKYNRSVCNYSAHVRGHIVKHMHIHTNERSFKCDMCDYTAAKKDNLKMHVTVKHSNTKKIYKCGDCEYSTYIKKYLVIHIGTHTDEKPFKCDICDYAVAHKGNLKKHVLVKHSNADKKYKCENCEYSAHLKANLVTHIRTHTNEKPFKCDMCDYVATQKGTLKGHIFAKHSITAKGYKCRDCEYSAYRKKDLVIHIRTHTNEKPFKCDRCDYAANVKGQLNRHVTVKHSNAEKMYKCRDCEYSAHRKDCLVRHIRTHTNEKPFKCDTCYYAVANKSNLRTHVLLKHSNTDKKYKCGDCEYSAHTKAHLVKHIRTHTNEKPFKCDICNYVATQKGALNGHILAKHSNAEKQEKCGNYIN